VEGRAIKRFISGKSAGVVDRPELRTPDNLALCRSSTTGARVSSLPTSSQVTGLVWSNHTKEIMSTHGYPDNHWTLWSYPSLAKVHEVTGAHDKRILGSSISPDGCTVVTGAADESLKVSGKQKASNERGERCSLVRESESGETENRFYPPHIPRSSLTNLTPFSPPRLAVLETMGTQDVFQDEILGEG
jgi:WD40 repeat protein